MQRWPADRSSPREKVLEYVVTCEYLTARTLNDVATMSWKWTPRHSPLAVTTRYELHFSLPPLPPPPPPFPPTPLSHTSLPLSLTFCQFPPIPINQLVLPVAFHVMIAVCRRESHSAASVILVECCSLMEYLAEVMNISTEAFPNITVDYVGQNGSVCPQL